MAGGLGTRLRPFTFSIPKPLLPVREKPILEFILRRLRRRGFQDIFLAIGYGAELVRAHFGNGKKFGVRIQYLEEPRNLGTAGPLRLLHPKSLSRPFLVMNGDILTRIDFRKLLQFHRQQKAELTVAVKNHTQQIPFGAIRMKGRLIQSIQEKPKLSQRISTGIYAMNPEALSFIPKGRFFTIPELITALLKNKRRVAGYEFSDYWLAIERVEQLEHASLHPEEWL